MAVMSVFVGFAINVQSSVLRHQFATLHQSNQKWLDSQDQVIQAMTKLLFVSSAETYEHSVRVMNLSLLLAREMGITDETELKHIKHGALLHDLGKLGVPAEILNRNGALTSDERKQIEEHPLIGDSVLRPIEFLQPTLDILRYHHERWNGTGYPYRLKGENIPRHARIVAVADCWDAMVNDRIYRQALSLQTAFDDIVSKAGTSYDPQTVEVFKRVIMKEHPELIDATSNKSAFLPHLVTEMLTLSAR
jgi:putative nucleotidyltransferase with HDIG domain